MNEIYYDICHECEYLHHCYDLNIAEKIVSGDTDDIDIYLHPGKCDNFYPEIMQ